MPLLFPNFGGSLSGGGGGGSVTLVSPWTEITGRSLETYYENTAANPIVIYPRVQGNNDTAHSDFHTERSTDGSTSAGIEGSGHTEDERDEIRLLGAIGAGEFSRARRGGTGSNTAAAIAGWYQQEITGAVDDFVDATASRALETSYENTTGDPIFILVATRGNNNSLISRHRMQTSPDNSTWTAVFTDKTQADNNWQNFAAVVPAGYFYRVIKETGSNTAAAVTCWVEKRLTGSTGALTDVTGSRALATAYTHSGDRKLAAHVMIHGNNSSAKSRFVFEVSSDGSTWTVDDGDITESSKDGVKLFGIVPAGYQYRARKISGSNTSFSLQSWLEQEIA